MPILECKRVSYYSEGDEAVYYDWITRISCVTKVVGSLDTEYLHIRGRRISDANLCELIALFYRYRISMTQLAQFESPRNRAWFTRPGTFWRSRVWPANSRAEGPRKNDGAGSKVKRRRTPN